MDKRNEPFKMTVRRCKRCGGILTNAKSVRDGYGHSCKMKEQFERIQKEQEKFQLSLFEEGAKDTNAY